MQRWKFILISLLVLPIHSTKQTFSQIIFYGSQWLKKMGQTTERIGGHHRGRPKTIWNDHLAVVDIWNGGGVVAARCAPDLTGKGSDLISIMLGT